MYFGSVKSIGVTSPETWLKTYTKTVFSRNWIQTVTIWQRSIKVSRTCATASSQYASVQMNVLAERSFCTRRQTALLATRGTSYVLNVSLVNPETATKLMLDPPNMAQIWRTTASMFRSKWQVPASYASQEHMPSNLTSHSHNHSLSALEIWELKENTKPSTGEPHFCLINCALLRYLIPFPDEHHVSWSRTLPPDLLWQFSPPS